jgi:hypothetical protein
MQGRAVARRRPDAASGPVKRFLASGSRTQLARKLLVFGAFLIFSVKKHQ